MEFHDWLGTLFNIHVTPESAEVYIGPSWQLAIPAASLVPSAEEARQLQHLLVAPLVVHVIPESIEA